MPEADSDVGVSLDFLFVNYPGANFRGPDELAYSHVGGRGPQPRERYGFRVTQPDPEQVTVQHEELPTGLGRALNAETEIRQQVARAGVHAGVVVRPAHPPVHPRKPEIGTDGHVPVVVRCRRLAGGGRRTLGLGARGGWILSLVLRDVNLRSRLRCLWRAQCGSRIRGLDVLGWRRLLCAR